jgi:EmrB/QacA subfamily drug resistance transporter
MTRTADIETIGDAGSASAQDPAARRRWIALAVLAVAQFMVFLDETVVNVALPSIKADLGFSQSSLPWVVNAYILMFGGLLLLGGRIADLFGRRRVFLIGTAIFGLASLADGLAGSEGMLLGARAVQGIGAALATPAALSLVTALFPPGRERTRALALWGALAGLGFAIGILLGGVITEIASWRWVFLINVPFAAATLAVVPRLVAESRVAGRGFDLPGAVAVTAGMTTLVYTVLEASDYGWRSAETHAGFGAAVVLLGTFAMIQRRSASPLIPARFLHRRATLVPNLLQLFLGASLISTFFLLTLYIQQVLGYTPLEAGLAYLPLAAAVASAKIAAERLMPRFGPRPIAAAGLAIASVGLVVLSRAPVGGDYLTDLLPALLPLGFGAGLSFPSITAAALARVDEDASGLASGLLSTVAQIAGALAIAILVAVVSERSGDLIGSGSAPLAAQVGGFQLAFAIAAGIAQLGSLVAMFALPKGEAAEMAS